MSPLSGSIVFEVEAGMAFHSGLASISSIVSNVWGLSPGPGMLCTRRPFSRVIEAGVTGGALPGSLEAAAGVAGAASIANARWVSAAAPGRSWYPISLPSS